MREEDVPQERSFYRGLKRACYAVNRDGNYVIAESEGWEVERVVTEQALLDLEQQVEETRQRVVKGELAPLAYHLAAHQMTPKLFAQHIGCATWRVKRHLKPKVFAKLGPDVIARYAACLDLQPDELFNVPSESEHVFLVDGDE